MEIEDRYKHKYDDDQYWKWGMFYFNPDDKRIFPPKRLYGTGWTVNFANWYSVLAMIVVLATVIFFFDFVFDQN
jgi:uncharacterized membrane protein